MDVLVKWRDGTINCVCINELKAVEDNVGFKVGVRVKMLYKRKWYYGTIISTEDGDDSSSDDEPLIKYVPNPRKENKNDPPSHLHEPLTKTPTETESFPNVNEGYHKILEDDIDPNLKDKIAVSEVLLTSESALKLPQEN